MKPEVGNWLSWNWFNSQSTADEISYFKISSISRVIPPSVSNLCSLIGIYYGPDGSQTSLTIYWSSTAKGLWELIKDEELVAMLELKYM